MHFKYWYYSLFSVLKLLVFIFILPSLLKNQDSEGNEVWICPACGRQDDGSPMIGCDDCDAWYHWYGFIVLFEQNFVSYNMILGCALEFKYLQMTTRIGIADCVLGRSKNFYKPIKRKNEKSEKEENIENFDL